MKPVTEKPINTIQDVFDRGQKLWIGYFQTDPEDPETKDCISLELISTVLRAYVMEKESTYATNGFTVPEHILNGIQDHGESILEFAEPFSDFFLEWRRAKENPIGSFQYQTFQVARKQIWKADFDLCLMRLFKYGINTRPKRMENNYMEYIDFTHRNDGNLLLLDLEKVSTMFALLLVGLFISLMAFIMEIIKKRPTQTNVLFRQSNQPIII